MRIWRSDEPLAARIEVGEQALLAACADSEPPIQRQLFEAIARARPDAVLFAGDAAYAGASDRRRRAVLRRWRREWGDLVGRVYAVPGNHDFDSPGALECWREEMSAGPGAPAGEEGLAFVVEVGPVLAVGLTSDGIGIPPQQLSWLERTLAEARAPNRIAVYHEPAWPCGQRAGDSLDRDPVRRDELWRLLEDGGVSLVLNGHEHGYSRRVVEGARPITQVVSAGAGARLYLKDSGVAERFEPAFNYLLLAAGPAGLRGRAIALDGRILDEFELAPAAARR